MIQIVKHMEKMCLETLNVLYVKKPGDLVVLIPVIRILLIPLLVV